MTFDICIISKDPPGGRCTLYSGYAAVLATHLPVKTEILYSDQQDAHSVGYPSLLLNNVALQPEDGVILMPDDILAALQQSGIDVPAPDILAEALEVPLNQMLDEAE
ncbi:MAG: hypothetical protein GC149_19680 [Gammaproteobacteria bacterium]|nr:hypothetical protein [Gammaproteobacteria bacterium]